MARSAMGPLTSNFLCIDLNKLRGWGWLRHGGRSGKIEWTTGANIDCRCDVDGLRLSYTHTSSSGGKDEVNDFVPITYAASGFGSQRAWFQCPGCRRRCGKLYGGARFRCRLCVGARYASSRESKPMRVIDQQWKLRERIAARTGEKWPSHLYGLDDGLPDQIKPRNMRWRTWRRFQAKDEALSRRWMRALGSRGYGMRI